MLLLCFHLLVHMILLYKMVAMNKEAHKRTQETACVKKNVSWKITFNFFI